MRRFAPLLLILLAPWLLLWPLPRVLGAALLSSPLSEGAAHLWGWWAALREGQPFSVHTTLLNYPKGLDFQLIDPLHLLPFALGAWVSPVLGFNLTLVFGLMVSGLGAWLLAREAGAEPEGRLVAAAVGLSAPTVLAVAVDGITEGLGAGWVAVQLAALLALRRGATPGRVVALGLALSAAVLSGPYNAVWAALIDAPVGLWLLRRTRAPLLAALGAALLCAPYLRALGARDPGLPGGAARAGLGRPLAMDPWRAAGERGVDLLDLFVPAPLTGRFADLPHTAYLGVVTLALAGLGAARLRRAGRGREAWCWAGGAAIFAALALGTWLSVGGVYPTVGDRPLLAPAGMLSLVTPLDRLTRWYRAGAVACLLLAPLAARAVQGRWAWLAAGAVLLDARLLSPLPRALPTVPVGPSSALAVADGPVAELPPVHPMFTEGRPADLNLLLQTWHGQPSTGTLHSQPGVATSLGALRDLRRIAVLQADPGQAGSAARQLRAAGYGWLAVYRDVFEESGIGALKEALGEPVASDAWVVLFRLPAASGRSARPPGLPASPARQ